MIGETSNHEAVLRELIDMMPEDIRPVVSCINYDYRLPYKTIGVEMSDQNGSLLLRSMWDIQEGESEEDARERAYKDVLKHIFASGLTNPNNVVKPIDDDSLPITREFIESFGFEISHYETEEYTSYRKAINEGNYFGYTLLLKQFKDHCFSLEIIDKSGNNFDYVFEFFTCTTRSELRFLLTKGRVDCSK